MWFLTLKFLFTWNKSIYKALWFHTLVYTAIYYALGLLYRFGLNDRDKAIFEAVCLAASKLPDTVTLVLILGFIAGQVMNRWWGIYSTIPGTGKIITLAQFYVKKSIDIKERSLWFRTLTRFIILSWLLFMRTMSVPIRRKYPTLDSLKKTGLILNHEVDLLTKMAALEDESKCSLYVVNWAVLLVRDAKDNGYFETSNDVARVLDPILSFKKACSSALKFKTTQFPPKFLQLVTIAVFNFGILILMGRQFVDPAASQKVLFIEAMYYIPALPTVQYLIFLAWLRLALEADDALGDDDTDFEMFVVFNNHVEAADNLLRLFDQNQFNPTRESLALTQQTLFKRDDSVKTRPLAPLLYGVYDNNDVSTVNNQPNHREGSASRLTSLGTFFSGIFSCKRRRSELNPRFHDNPVELNSPFLENRSGSV